MPGTLTLLPTLCLALVLAACAPVAAEPTASRPSSPSPPGDVAHLVGDWQVVPAGFGTPVPPEGLDAEESAAWRHGVDAVGLLLAPAQTHPGTLRGDPGPVTSLASGWLAGDLAELLAPGQGLRALVWTTRFPPEVLLTGAPRVRGRWRSAALFDGSVTWEGSFAYPLERDGETTWVVVHRRLSAQECDATGCGAMQSRLDARGVDLCASHLVQSFVPSFEPLTPEDVAAGVGTSDVPDVEQVIADCAAGREPSTHRPPSAG
jgi:hypothetical protein